MWNHSAHLCHTSSLVTLHTLVHTVCKHVRSVLLSVKSAISLKQLSQSLGDGAGQGTIWGVLNCPDCKHFPWGLIQRSKGQTQSQRVVTTEGADQYPKEPRGCPCEALVCVW